MGGDSPRAMHVGLPVSYDGQRTPRAAKSRGLSWPAIAVLSTILLIALLNIGFMPKHALPGSKARKGSAMRKEANFVRFPNVNICQSNSTLDAARQSLAGHILCPGDNGFLESIRVFNSRFQRQPAVVVQPLTTADIVSGLALARQHSLRVSVKGGGHNPAGLAVPDGVLLFDMQRMRSVDMDRDSMTVTVGGGTLWKDIYDLLQGTDLAIVGGGCPSVGAVGLALSGGIGWLSRVHGLVADNLVSATLVLANGTVMVVSTEQNSKYLWGLRGAGGSNFGVVSSATLRLHRAQRSYFAGTWTVPVMNIPQLSSQLKMFEQFTLNVTDDRLTADIIVETRGAGSVLKPRVSVQWIMIFNGPKDEALPLAKPLLDQLAASITSQQACQGKPVACKLITHRMAVTESMKQEIAEGRPFLVNHTFSSFASMFGASMSFYTTWKSAFVDSLPTSVADRLASAIMEGTGQPSMLNLNMQFEMLGGAMSREPEHGSSYIHRDRKILISPQGFSMLAGPGMKEADIQETKAYMQSWTTRTYEAMRGIRLGAYAGYADPELPGWDEKYYSAETYRKLQEMKDSLGASKLFHTPMRIGWRPEEDSAGRFGGASRGSSSMPRGLGRLNTGHSAAKAQRLTRNLNLGSHAESERVEPCAAQSPVDVNHPFLAADCCPSWALQLAAAVKDGTVSKSAATTQNLFAGQHMLVVGGTSGLGNAVARMLGSMGATVILAQRGSHHGCEAEARRSANDIGAPDGTFLCVKLNLADFSTIPAAVSQMKRLGAKYLHGVVLSASTWGEFRPAAGAGDISSVFAVNVVGQVVLMQELIRAGLMRRKTTPFRASQHTAMLRTAVAEKRGGIDAGEMNAANHWLTRVVVVSSFAAVSSAPRESVEGMLANRRWEGGLFPDSPDSPSVQAYGASKALGFLMGMEMAERLKGFVSVMVHFPMRAMRTNLTETITRPHAEGGAKFQLANAPGELASAEEGAIGIVMLMAEKAHSGHLYVGCQDASPWLEGGSEIVGRGWPEHLKQPLGEFQCKAWHTVQRWANQTSPSTLEALSPFEAGTEAGSMLQSLWRAGCQGKAYSLLDLSDGFHTSDASDKVQVLGGW